MLILTALVVISSQVESSDETLFATDLYKALGTDGNLVFSPYSIQTCLSLVYMGAGGKTASELATGLRFGSMSKEEVANWIAKVLVGNGTSTRSQLKITNKVFLNKDFEISESFAKLSKQSFGAGAENIDFSKSSESERIINDWVAKETNRRIKNLLPPGTIGEDTNALLVNTIYFRGEWEHHFPKMLTRKNKFYSSSSDEGVETDFLIDVGAIKYGDLSDLDATAIEKKYKDGNFSMVFVLPQQVDGLAGLSDKVQTNNYNLMTISDKLYLRQVQVLIPKFETEYEFDLKKPMSKLGMETMFTNQADFRDLCKGSFRPMKITKALHKAVIKVDEAGSEASAVTRKPGLSVVN